MKNQSNVTYEKAERIKNNITGFSVKSKETIRELISNSSKQMENVMEVNTEILNSIKKNLDFQKVDSMTADAMKHAFVKSLELAENTFDAIINSYTRQMEYIVDFNTQLLEAVKESTPKNADKFLDLINDNFERSQELNSKNTKEILEFYNKHTNLALNFNKRFSDNVNAQIEIMVQIQSKGFDQFSDWTAEWWKQSVGTEKASLQKNNIKQ